MTSSWWHHDIIMTSSRRHHDITMIIIINTEPQSLQECLCKQWTHAERYWGWTFGDEFFYEDDDDTNLSSSESSLSSLVGVVFKPPFLARGHPDRLRTRKAKHMDHEDGNLSLDRLSRPSLKCVSKDRLERPSRKTSNHHSPYLIHSDPGKCCTFCVRRSSPWCVPIHRSPASDILERTRRRLGAMWRSGCVSLTVMKTPSLYFTGWSFTGPIHFVRYFSGYKICEMACDVYLFYIGEQLITCKMKRKQRELVKGNSETVGVAVASEQCLCGSGRTERREREGEDQANILQFSSVGSHEGPKRFISEWTARQTGR